MNIYYILAGAVLTGVLHEGVVYFTGTKEDKNVNKRLESFIRVFLMALVAFYLVSMVPQFKTVGGASVIYEDQNILTGNPAF
jgi:hypothetical protein